MHLDALFEGAELARAGLLEGAAAEGRGRRRELGQRLHVEAVALGRAALGGLKEEEHL